MKLENLDLNGDIRGLKPADYNPRAITSGAVEKLKTSLKLLGCVKPIIVRNNTIVAGHQRTRALLEMGITQAPVYRLTNDASYYDEVRFNQLHNGTDIDQAADSVIVDITDLKPGFNVIPPVKITVPGRPTGATLRHQIMDLMTKFGPWGAAVVNSEGRVFHAPQYAIACKILKKPLLVYLVEKEKEQSARLMLAEEYGVFNYDSLKRNTYIQTLAQLFRLRDAPSGKQFKSPTYENLVIPYLKKNPKARVLDFGCGQGDYAKRLTAQGYSVRQLEFFRRAPGINAIDVTAVNGMVDQVISDLRTFGRYDAVVCDYVMNSVDSVQAESDVLTCLHTLCKLDGDIFFSGRMRNLDDRLKRRKQSTGKTDVSFLDENGLTAILRKGVWFYQKFHSKEDVQKICQNFKWPIVQLNYNGSIAWQVHVKNSSSNQLPSLIAEAVNREFNMIISREGRTLGRNDDIKAALCSLQLL